MFGTRRFLLAALVMFAALILSACGPSFSEYMRNVRTSQVNSNIKRSPEVVIGSTDVGGGFGTFGLVTSGISLAGDIAASAVSMEQQKRLQTIISPEMLVDQIHNAFSSQFSGSTGIPVVSYSEHSDIRIVITVPSFGIYASSITSPYNFFMNADVSVVYLPENKRIYDRQVFLERSLGDLDMYGSIASVAISGALNLSAFFTLSDPQIVEIFNYLAVELGNTIATYIFEDSL